MAIKIIKATEASEIKNIMLIICGASGVGKTTLGCTADKPLLLDFEKCGYRAKETCSRAEISCKDDIDQLFNSDLSDYNTIVIDSLGYFIDLILTHAQGADRNTTFKHWGIVRTYFRNFFFKLRSLGKDLVILAQEAKEKDNNQKISYELDGQGKTKDLVYQLADLMCRITKIDKVVSLEFSSTESTLGKDCCNFGKQIVPNYEKCNDYLGNLITIAKEKINTDNKLQAEKKRKEEEILAKIATADIDGLNELLGDKFIQESKNRYFKVEMFQRSKNLGLEYDSTTKQFEIKGDSKE